MGEPPWDCGADNGWDQYAAWERWLTRVLDDALPDDAAAVLDTLDGVQKAYLYNVMSRLAAGEFPPAAAPRGVAS